MPESAQKVIHELTAAGILSSAEVTKFDKEIEVGVEALIKRLVDDGRVTQYQADKFLSGKGGEICFGDYVVIEELGRGGMGTVLLAKHRRMEREVAIKVLSVSAFDSKPAISRFYQEVKVAAKLGHPNIVHAYDAGEHHGFHYLVMEYVKGHDLAHVLDNLGPIPVTLAIDYVMQASHGLEYAHRKGIVHRDIKPSNLLLDDEGVVKVLDMGLARLSTGIGSNETSMNLTMTGQVMGTVEYMSPEQAEDTRAADHRSDIYSLGCTLYRLVTGQSPFARDTVVKTILAHRETPIPLMAAGDDPAIAQLNPIFQRMVAKNPDDRFQSITSLLQELRQLEERLSSAMGEMTIGPDSNVKIHEISDNPTMPPERGSTNPNMGNLTSENAHPSSSHLATRVYQSPDGPSASHQPIIMADSAGNVPVGSGPVGLPHGMSNPHFIGIKHHRGKTIIAMGIFSLATLACMVGFPVGIAVWLYARSDIDEMNRGLRDASGMRMTKTGKIIAQCAVGIGTLTLFFTFISILFD